MKHKVFCATMLLFILSFGSSGLLLGADKGEASGPGPEFLLGPEDVLEISVWKDEALTKHVVVRPDGKISFPLIGDIVAQGRTVEALRQAVEEKIREYVPDAPVTVLVAQLGSPKVYVVGKVARPGVYIMGQKLTVLQLLAVAGGMTPFSDTDDILIIRTENGKSQTIKFDYKRVAGGKDLEQNVVLQPGDTIVVP